VAIRHRLPEEKVPTQYERSVRGEVPAIAEGAVNMTEGRQPEPPPDAAQ